MSDTKNLHALGSKNTTYNFDDPASEQLESFDYESKGPQAVGFITSEFTSLCPKTNQPDFANIEIVYVPRAKGIESKSLKLYLFRYRNHGSFHEDCISKILNDIVKAINPYFIKVVGDFTSRGGIAIKPVSVYYSKDSDKATIDSTVMHYNQSKFVR